MQAGSGRSADVTEDAVAELSSGWLLLLRHEALGLDLLAQGLVDVHCVRGISAGDLASGASRQ